MTDIYNSTPSVGTRNRQTLQLFLLAGVAFLLIPFEIGCSRTASDPGDSRTQIVTSADPNVIESDHPERFPLVEVESREVADELHVNGVVAPDVNRTVPVLSLGGGRVVEIRVRLGDDVKKGQVLLLIGSPDLGSAFSDYQLAAWTCQSSSDTQTVWPA